MKYSIGDVSRVLGITPGALHYYEREGVISAPKEKESGHRYYAQEDVIRLLSCRKYRSMDMPLKTIAKQFSVQGDPLEKIHERLCTLREEAERKAAYYLALADEIDSFSQCIARLPEDEGVFRVRSSPENYLLLLQDGLLSRDKQEQQWAKHWLNAMPATRISIVMEGEQARYGYSITKERAKAFGVDISHARRVPEQMCIHAIIRDEGMNEEGQLAFVRILDYMRARGLQCTGTPWATLLVVDCSRGRKETYAEVWVPFE